MTIFLKNRLKVFLLAAIIFFMVFAVTFGAAFINPAFDKNEKNLALLGTLTGFSPGTKVSYHVMPEEGKSIAGTITADASGTVGLPAYNMYNAAGKQLALALRVEEGENPLDLALILNADNGKIEFEGRGLKEFSNVGFGGAGISSKADWAGIVKNPAAGDLNDIGREGGFKVALYDNNLMSDVPRQNPKIIEIYSAPGGGLFKDSNINVYDTPYGCKQDDDLPKYSFCYETLMKQDIKQIVDLPVTGLLMMGNQLTAVMAMQMAPVGAMFDAKIQLEAQRELQNLQAEAHKDYHPGELMCEFGTFVKSISTAEEKARGEKKAINEMLINYYTDLNHTSSAQGALTNTESRMKQFREVYCDPQDNNNGLVYMCDWNQDQAPGPKTGGTDPKRFNKDVDYIRTLDQPLTLDVDFVYSHSNAARPSTGDEEDILALAKNLYWPSPLTPGIDKELPKKSDKFINSRQLMATAGIAHNSFGSLAAMKSKTSPGLGAASGWNFMKALMRDFGITDPAEMNKLLGSYPSYYAQMEVLTKKMYQNPDFYTNLYDKPANIERVGVAMEAITIMQQRDFFESALRREMLTSLMVEQALDKHIERLNGEMPGAAPSHQN